MIKQNESGVRRERSAFLFLLVLFKHASINILRRAVIYCPYSLPQVADLR